MLYTNATDLGKIQFDENIIANIIRKAVDSFDGRVMLSGAKGRIKKQTQRSKSSDDLTFMNIKKVDDEYTIDIYMVLKFGTSIKKTSGELIQTIRTQVTEMTGFKIHKVRIIITGMLSKNFIRRHIEVEG